ncbi:MAG: HAD-IIIC family phosphatase, partial [Polymorphobacter sp.]
VAGDYRMLGLDVARLGAGAAEAAVAAALGQLKTIAAALAPSVSGGILVQTLVPPVEPLFGSYDAVQPGSVASMVAALNLQLAQWAADRQIILVDVARAASWVGLDHWTDPARWHAAKLPMALDAVPLYTDIVARTLAAATVGPKKCLVLDLDNTLWGGVIGDDGVEGIALGQGSGAGEAFVAIQRMALELRARGIILAVCSKNEEAAALLPFTQHPEMLLKTADIAVFQANWTDKASNLRAIATALNIGVDALVFLDDNPVERGQVRRELPMVGVPELPDDPALYPRLLQCAGYFDTIAFLDEDRLRADNYAADAARQAIILEAGGSDVAGYLASLDMVCDLRPFDGVGRARISQLVNKSNQYNLTTRRYTEAEIAAIEADASKFTLQVRLADRFGDNGMISVIIFDKQAREWVCDTWLMSCRVLGRRVEEAVLRAVAAAAAAAGATRLVGHYLPSPKNKMVANHFSRLGFALVAAHDDGRSDWALDLAGYEAPELPMQLTGSGEVR